VGSFAYLGDGSTAKSLNAGSGAQAGVLAASLAAAGADGPALAFEGPLGVVESYFRLPADALAEDVADLGERWETLAIAFKTYPACHFVPAAIAAAAEAAGGWASSGSPSA
jgi:2-methylcitrate dehydratase PrpD